MPGTRLKLAQTAASAASACEGVASLLDGDGRWTTADDGGTIRGVVVTATVEDRYLVDVHLSAHPGPLVVLGSRVRLAIQSAADQAGLEDLLGPVGVHVEALAADAGDGPA